MVTFCSGFSISPKRLFRAFWGAHTPALTEPVRARGEALKTTPKGGTTDWRSWFGVAFRQRNAAGTNLLATLVRRGSSAGPGPPPRRRGGATRAHGGHRRADELECADRTAPQQPSRANPHSRPGAAVRSVAPAVERDGIDAQAFAVPLPRWLGGGARGAARRRRAQTLSGDQFGCLVRHSAEA
jgi:hypothetical protein